MTPADTLETITDPKFRQLCEEVVIGMDRLPVIGAVVGVFHDGKEYVAGFGVTSVEHPLPVTEDTLFQIGSITKTYTATALMRLVEMGRLEVDAPVRAYVPALRLSDESVAAQVTVRHLLTHTGGWVGDYFNDFGLGEDALSRMVASLALLPQLTPLGAVWSYNNTGFYLAGRIVEAITGKSFETALKELVFDPLGLTMSFFFPHDVLTHRFSVGHEIVDRQPKVARPWALPRSAAPAGGIICSVGDLFRYARFHTGDGAAPDGTRLLSPGTLALMQTPMFSASGINMIGLSWFISNVNGVKIIGHSGSTNGQVSDVRIVPERKFAVAVLTNSSTGRTLCYDESKSALRRYLDVTLPEPMPLELPPDTLSEYTGRYDSALAVGEVSFQDGGLALTLTFKGGFPTPDSPPPPSPPPMRIALYDEDRMIALDDPFKSERGEFLRDPDGHIAWLRVAGRVFARQT